jgi:HAD superfamily hydrolase (TIGR01509 family)
MPLETHRIQAILFDIDGTLSDTDDQMANRIANAPPFRLIRNQTRRKKLARWLVMAMESPGNFIYNLADRFNLDSLFISLLDWRTRQRSSKPKPFWIIPGIENLLKSLAMRFPLAIVSARDENGTLGFLRQFNLEPYFMVVVTSQSTPHTKPFPDPLWHAAKLLAIAPENCLMVGDTTVDIHSARLAGMQSVGVLCGFGTERELLRAGADCILPVTTDLPTVLG